MRHKAVQAIDEHSEAGKDALSLLAIALIGSLSNFVSGLVADDAVYSTIANIVTILSFIAAVIRTGFIFMDWRERRKMIAIKKKVQEEEDAKVAAINAREKRQDGYREELQDATTGDEIAKILRRNALDKLDE